MAKNNSEYEYPIPDEDHKTGFYIVCNDRMILENVNYLMKGRGYVGVTDMRGRLNYMVDGRDNLYMAVHNIVREVGYEERIPAIPDSEIFEAIEEMAKLYDIDRGLVGAHLLRSMLVRCVRSPELLRGVSKKLYLQVSLEFDMSAIQVERNLRYVLIKSRLGEMGYRNVSALRFLYEHVLLRLVRKDDLLCDGEFPYDARV